MEERFAMLVTSLRNTSVHAVDHPIENWVDVNGQHWRRASLGAVAAGHLILGGVGRQRGGV